MDRAKRINEPFSRGPYENGFCDQAQLPAPAARDGHNALLTPHIAAGSLAAGAAGQARADDYTIIMNHLEGRPIIHRLA